MIIRIIEILNLILSILTVCYNLILIILQYYKLIHPPPEPKRKWF